MPKLSEVYVQHGYHPTPSLGSYGHSSPLRMSPGTAGTLSMMPIRTSNSRTWSNEFDVLQWAQYVPSLSSCSIAVRDQNALNWLWSGTVFNRQLSAKRRRHGLEKRSLMAYFLFPQHLCHDQRFSASARGILSCILLLTFSVQRHTTGLNSQQHI